MKFNTFNIFGIFLFTIFSCNQNAGTSRTGKLVKDYFNRSINIPQNIERIIPLYYVQAEIICAIGAKDKIVGIGKINERSSLFLNIHFPEMMKMPQVGQGNINYEKIISLKPDIVFTGTEKPVIEQLEQLGYVAIATYPKSLKDIIDETVFYGDILGKRQESLEIYELFKNIEDKVFKISKNIPPNKRPKVYYVRTDALTTLGGNVQGEIIDLAGGQLVTNGLGDNATSLQMSFEDIYKYNPDVIIIRDRASIKSEDIFNDDRWKNINAVKNKKVFQEHSGWTEYRLETIFGIIEKAKWLQPELFREFNPETDYNKFIEIVRQNNQ